jgi:capsular exopolysaccharide synthesis family protein
MGRIFDVVQKYRVEQVQPDEAAGLHLLPKVLPEDAGAQAKLPPPGGVEGLPDSTTVLTHREEKGRSNDGPSTKRRDPDPLEDEPPHRGIEPVLPSESPAFAVEPGQTSPTESDTVKPTVDHPDHGQSLILRKFKDLRTAYVKGEGSRTRISRPGSRKETYELIAVEQPDSPFAESFRIIRARLLHLMRERRIRTVQVTSCNPGEGKSFFSSNMAATIAQGFDESVLLVDADLRKPSQHHIYETPLEPGLTDLLTDPTRDVLDLTAQTNIGKLTLLTAGTMHAGSPELLDSDLMRMFLQVIQLRLDNRYIILDSPPLIISEALTLSRQVDGIVLIIDTRKTPRPLAQQAIEMVGKDKILGVVMNNCSIPLKNYKYYGSCYKGYYQGYRARQAKAPGTRAGK